MEAGISRISVETEADWLRVKANVEECLDRSLEARLAGLPGGKDGEASRAVRKEAERRLAKVRALRPLRRLRAPEYHSGDHANHSLQVKEDMWKMAKSNISVNGHNYEDFVEGMSASHAMSHFV